MTDKLQYWADVYAARAPKLAGAQVPWLAQLRRQALERFMSEGWPTPKNNEFHHTSLAPLAAAKFTDDAGPSAAEAVRAFMGDEPGHWIVFVDGAFDAGLSRLNDLPGGLTIAPVSQALAQHGDAIQTAYGAVEDGHSPAALNLALASDGAWVHLAAGTAVADPIHILSYGAAPQAAHFVRHVIQAEAGAQATVVEHYASAEGAQSFSHAGTRLQIDRDARITHIKLQQESTQAWHLADVTAVQQRHSYFASHSVSIGARLARNDITTHFADERCETMFNGLYYADKRRLVDHHTLIDHDKPNCVSHENYRGILADTAHGVFSGRILVAEGADGTDAIQRTDSLLLSRLAKADARPELEIYAEDVKCAHGATVGQLDENSLFYLRTRGLDEAHARDILIYAFAASSLARIESESLRRRVSEAVLGLLPGHAAIEVVV